MASLQSRDNSLTEFGAVYVWGSTYYCFPFLTLSKLKALNLDVTSCAMFIKGATKFILCDICMCVVNILYLFFWKTTVTVFSMFSVSSAF